jgi:Mpv17 / PMP22 family
MTTRMKLLAVAMILAASDGFRVSRTTANTRQVGQQIRRDGTPLKAFAVDGALSAVDTFFQTEPYLSAFLACSVKASAADWVAQSQAPAEERNLNRNLAFIVYGGLYQGCMQSFIFGVLFPAWFPGDASTQSILTQVAIDIFVLGPLVAMPTVYSIKALFAGEEHFVSSGVGKYIEQIQTKGILFKYWAIWGPVQTLSFWLVPPHLRVFFVAMVSFFWVCLLSNVSSSSSSGADTSNININTGLLLPKDTSAIPVPVLSEAYESQVQQSLLLKARGKRRVSQPQWARSTSS